MMESYSTVDIERIINIQRPCFREWQIRGYVQPSIEQAKGRGTKNRYSRQDIYKIYLFKALIDSGLSREKAAMIVRTLHPEDWTKERIKVSLNVLVDVTLGLQINKKNIDKMLDENE